MIICIANTSNSISNKDFSASVKAIKQQVTKHFAPAWGMTAAIKTVVLKDKSVQHPELNQADVIIYVGELGDDPNSVDGALGYHSLNHTGVPFGFVFTDVAAQYGEEWTVTLSHEVLELVADPDVNLLVMAPNPKTPSKTCLMGYEVCDPVQGDSYEIDGIKVSNFVTPLYFAELDSKTSTKTNYLDLPLVRFGVRPNGYLSYLDLQSGTWQNVFGEYVEERMAAKARMKNARRAVRRSASFKG